jgi:hypothetical protein
MIDKSFQALILSLILHALLLIAFIRSPLPKKAPDLTPIEVVYGGPKLKRDVIIDDLKPKADTLQRLKDQAAHLSRLNRRVKEEQVAAPTPVPQVQNMGHQGRSGRPSAPPPSPNMAQNREGKNKGDNDSRSLILPGMPPAGGGQRANDFSKVIAIGDSTQGEWIPGVKEGSFTALNTDQFTYYTFFARVKDAIRYRWISRVRNFSQRASPDEIMTLARIPMATKVQVTLSKQGDILKVATLGTSGSSELDAAASKAFWDAGRLQNPPVEMADDDGLIRLYYGFQVIWQPTYMAKDNP